MTHSRHEPDLDHDLIVELREYAMHSSEVLHRAMLTIMRKAVTTLRHGTFSLPEFQYLTLRLAEATVDTYRRDHATADWEVPTAETHALAEQLLERWILPEAKRVLAAERHVEEVPSVPRSYSKAELKRLVIDSGSHYFDRDTMRFFGSRIESSGYVDAKGNVFFVTSEQRTEDEPRLYTVREFWGTHPRTVGRFQGYQHREDAMDEAKRLARGGVSEIATEPNRDERHRGSGRGGRRIPSRR